MCIEESGRLYRELNDAVAHSYSSNYLRKSIVNDPVYGRENTGTNTPAIVSTSFTGRQGISVEVHLKGGGSENCSYLRMLNPSSGPEAIIGEVKRIVEENVTKCCPPVIIGLGIGSTASGVTSLARKASFRNLDIRNADPRYRQLEQQILSKINSLGIGPQGLGGNTTALACNIEVAPCHMATLPVAVFLGCHSLRRASAKISPPYTS
ncbi:MAG: fumarate hydratase [Actinomycetota bacterium]|nr:fumarate hydratase [Actinomycetota bacterium]